ncbi:MAG: hypothetical protein JO345_22965 [Streptosporangiaceae bacterium]|nr:hypothetical protein [Streptosporangiaceae bacterium]
MASTVTAGAVAAGWHEPVRGLFQPAWDALDRTQIALYHRYEDTHDERVGDFKSRFEEAADALICLAIDELYAPYDRDVHVAGDELSEDRETGGPDQ